MGRRKSTTTTTTAPEHPVEHPVEHPATTTTAAPQTRGDQLNGCSPQLADLQLELPADQRAKPVGFRVHLDLHLTPVQASALRALVQGLDHRGARLRNGKRVTNYNGGIRWFLESLADRLP